METNHLVIIILVCFLRGAAAITYFYMDQHCGGAFDVTFKHQVRLKLTSSYSYKSDMSCQVTVFTKRSSRMMVFFKDLDIERTSNCTDDYLEMHDGISSASPKIGGGRKCGHYTPTEVYTTSGRNLTLYFTSDGAVSYKGFDMIITSYHTGLCKAGEYRCRNDRCIDNFYLTCNKYNPCGDYSDCPSRKNTGGGTSVSLSVGGIAGVAIGCIVFATIFIVAVIVARRRLLVVQPPTPVATVASSYDYNQPVPTQYAPPPTFPGATSNTPFPQSKRPVY